MIPESGMKKGHDPKKMAKALQSIVDENRASMAKGFTAVTPHMFGMELMAKPMPDVAYPELRLSVKDIPAAKDWKVGERYSIELVVEQTGLTDRIGSDAKVEFSIIGVKAGGKIEKSDKAKKAERAASGENNEGDNSSENHEYA